MKRYRLFIAVLLAVLMATPAAAQIRIAVAGPMTGSLALLGLQIRDGAEAAVAAINAAGGVLGEQIELTVANDNCSEDRADAVANQLAGAGVALVIGHLCSPAAIAASEVYAEEEIIQIAPGAPDPRFTEDRPGPGVFRLFGREDDQGATAAAYLASLPADTRIAVIDDRSPYGRRLTDDVLDGMALADRQPVLVEVYSVANPDFTALAARLNVANADIAFVGGYGADIAELVLELDRLNADVTVMGGDTLAMPDFAEAAGEAANGTLFTGQFDPRSLGEARSAIDVLAGTGIDAGALTLFAYVALEVWAAAVEAVGSADYAPVSEAIATGSFETVLGEISFNEIGEVSLPGWQINIWQDGAFGPLTP